MCSATEIKYPDSLTLLTPILFTSEGIASFSSRARTAGSGIISLRRKATLWSTIATLANCHTPLQRYSTSTHHSVLTQSAPRGLRITVTLTEKASADFYSQMNEIIPVITTNRSGTTTSLKTLQPSSAAEWDAPSGATTSVDVFQSNSSAEPMVYSGSPTHKPQPQKILARLFGGKLGISLLVLAVSLLRKRPVPGERNVTHQIGTLAEPSPA